MTLVAGNPFSADGIVAAVDDAYRARRTCMSVPASSERFIAKARDLPVDEVMLDLEDSVAPDAKPGARELAVAALRAGGWASSERFIAKARDLPVDEVMLDLEDSVAPDAKPGARELAVAALRAGGWNGKLVAVRVNDVTTPWAYQDVIAVAEAAPGAVDTLILPKVSDPAAVVWLDVLLGQLERAAGLAPGRIGIEAQIEDAAGLAAVEAFTPSPDDYARAVRILDAYELATSVDRRGAVMLDGEMIDEASRKLALAIVAKGTAAGL